MTNTYILIAICFFNIVMWIIFITKFRKIFTTEDVVTQTREALNSMLIDINKNASRNIDVIDDRIKQLKAVTAEADRHLMVLKGELDKVEKSKAFIEKLDALSKTEEPASVPKAATRKTASRTRAKTSLPPVERYVEEQMQGNLFASDNSSSKSESKSLKPSVDLDEISRKIPVIEPEIFMAEKPVVPKKDFNTAVRELYEKGESVEDIAAILGRSTQEVKFSLEFS